MRKNFIATCSYYAFDNLRHRLRMRRGAIEATDGTAHASMEVARSVAYIESVFGQYKIFSGISRFHGRVAEVGPGDSCGVGLMFLNDDCAQVDLVDRFYAKRSPEHHAQIYRALLAKHPKLAVALAGADLADESTFPNLRRYYGEMASAEGFFRGRTAYDFIVSTAVMEHAYAPKLAIRRMAAALKRGGMLLHSIDLRDHLMFSEFFHELKFLEVPDWLYGPMTRDAGRPNRLLVDGYRAVIGSTGLDYRILVTQLAGVGRVSPPLPYEEIDPGLREKALAYVRSVRPRFARSLKDTSDADLAIVGFFLVARRT